MRSQAFAPRSHSPFVFMIGALTLIALAPMARADYIWVGGNTGAGGDDSWTNTNNWLSGLVPDSAGAQTARIGSGDPNTNGTGQAFATATVGAGVNATDGTSLFVSDNQINAGTLILSGGSLTVGGPTLTIGGNGNSGGFGTLSMSDGTITLPGAGAQFELGNVSNVSFQNVNAGTYLMSGGTVSFTGGGSNHLSLTIRGTGTMNMSGGTISIPTGSIDISRAGGMGTLVMSGGTITTNTMFFSTATGGTGTLLMTGGQITTNANTHGASGGMYAEISGGTYTTNTVSVSGEANNSTGTLILDGGKFTGTAVTVASGTNNMGSVQITSGTVNLTSITMGTGTNNFGSVIISGGQVKVTNAITMSSFNSATTTLTINGGSVVAGSINTSGNSANGAAKSFLTIGQTNSLVPTEVDLLRIGQGNNPATILFNGGTLTVGTIGAAMHQTTWSAGTLSPGDFTQVGGGASFGTTLFTASNNSFFTQGVNHHIHIDVGDNTLNNPNTANKDYIQMNTSTAGSGTVTLNGTINVDFIGTNPTLGAIYDIIKSSIANGIVDNSTLVADQSWIQFSKAIVTTTNANDTLELTITGVPEPSMMGLVGIGALGLLRRRARWGKARPCRNLASSGG